jgi:hypothetical protein
MPIAALVVSHGGHGTVARALGAGTPVLISPITGDMGETAMRVSWAGAGLSLPWRLCHPGPLRWATRRLLADPSFRARAEEIAAWGRRATDWVPPSALGPLPVELRERAALLLQHQLAVAERLVERITQSQRQRDVAARMSYGPSRPVAAFIDQAL